MTDLPEYYFQDIAAEVMAEIADAMEKNDWNNFSIAACESRNHSEHRGELGSVPNVFECSVGRRARTMALRTHAMTAGHDSMRRIARSPSPKREPPSPPRRALFLCSGLLHPPLGRTLSSLTTPGHCDA